MNLQIYSLHGTRSFSGRRIQKGSIFGFVTVEWFWMEFMLLWCTACKSQTHYCPTVELRNLKYPNQCEPTNWIEHILKSVFFLTYKIYVCFFNQKKEFFVCFVLFLFYNKNISRINVSHITWINKGARKNAQVSYFC